MGHRKWQLPGGVVPRGWTAHNLSHCSAHSPPQVWMAGRLGAEQKPPERWEAGPSACSIPGMPAPHSAALACYANTRGLTHNGSRQPGLASQTPPPPPPTPLCFPPGGGGGWGGQSGGPLGKGPRPGPFLQGRKGLLGGWECWKRMNGHANEMLMSLGQAQREGLTCPLAPMPISGLRTALGGEGGTVGLPHALPSV